MKAYINSTKAIRAIAFLGIYSIFLLPSCKKQDNFLDIKSQKSDVSPTTLSDFQAVLDNALVMNSENSILGLVGTDNLYITDANLSALDATTRNAYLWNADIYQGSVAGDWLYDYQMVEYANIVIDGLNKISSQAADLQYQNIKGAALFYRCYGLYQASQLYCKPYSATSGATDLGIPIRLTSDVNVISVRSSVEQTYQQIIGDLKTAITLLPQSALYKTRPTSVAANALLAKVYLSMGDYENASLCAESALKASNTLLDYNMLKITATNPFPSFAKGNPEILLYAESYGLTAVIGASSVKGRVAPDLYSLYQVGDLRKTALYTADGTTGLYKFKGSYAGGPYNFCGIATNELYLIHAECQARLGNSQAALSDLNTLLKNRYTPVAFTPITISEPTSLISMIILERRKEMPFTGNLRWEDLRRINSDTRFAVTLQRTYQGAKYSLLPNSNRYVYPLPQDETTITGLQQNNR